MNDTSDGLIPMTPSRKRLREGDVFQLKPFPGVFFCGKVIRINVESQDSFVNGMNLIYLYDMQTAYRAIPEDLETAPLLISPVIINRLPWSRGYFETVGNRPVREWERGLSFGFWDFLHKRFVDVSGRPLGREPPYWSDYGLASYAVVGKKVRKTLESRGLPMGHSPL